MLDTVVVILAIVWLLLGMIGCIREIANRPPGAPIAAAAATWAVYLIGLLFVVAAAWGHFLFPRH